MGGELVIEAEAEAEAGAEMAVEGRRLPAMVRKEGQKPLLQLRSLLQTAVSTARLRPSSVSLGTIATQLLATPVCVVCG